LKSSFVVLVLALFVISPVVCFSQSERNQLAALTVADFTRPSPGDFVSGWNAGTKITQFSRAGVGQSLEYRYLLRGNTSAGLLYSRTPTDSKLVVPNSSPDIWPITRNEFDVLLTQEMKPLMHGLFSPYGTAGAGAIVLNGGKSESGLDAQFAWVAGGGADIRISYRIRLRIGCTADILKASTFSDPTYRSSWTAMAEPRIGFVLPLSWRSR
jgi:hypothetical protein